MKLAHLAFRVLLGIAITGCGGDSTAPIDPAGTYTLSTVNGTPLPAVISSNINLTTYAVSGGIVLRADRTFTETRGMITVATGHAPIGPTLIGITPGSYTVSGQSITFDFGGTTFVGQFGSDFVSYTDGTAILRFQKS